jgi:hypothetical protein
MKAVRCWLLISLLLMGGCIHQYTRGAYTRGVGVYPGDPKEDFGAMLVPADQTYRNVALHRPAYHSSSYDYNLTAQLVTDGIKEKGMPRWVVVSTSQEGVLTKQVREHVLDHNTTSTVNLTGSTGWVQLELAGGEEALEFDRLEVTVRVNADADLPAGWTCRALVSADGQNWQEVGRTTGANRPEKLFQSSIPLTAPSHDRFLRVELAAPSVAQWRVCEVGLFDKNEPVEVGGPYRFYSAWKSAGSGAEWIYVDLGASCTFGRVALSWIRRAAEGVLQVSEDAQNWRTLLSLPTTATGAVDDLKLEQPARGRYVRLLLTRAATPEGYILSEFEVYGRGGLIPEPKPAAGEVDGRRQLSGGAWRIQRDSLVTADGPGLSQPGFDDKDWLPATVPGTVLSSFLDAGAIPDPNFGDNQLMISDSFFWADFWYRNEFVGPRVSPGRHVWLNFNGINWKAEVFLNGKLLGRIEGGFIRGHFDVTRLLRPEAPNALAVRILKNATPGSVKEKTFETPDLNGGALGLDDPTYHATAGWDWIPTMRGRDIGIWSSISLNTSGPVTIENPFVSAVLPLPDTTAADVTVEATLHNTEARAVSGTLHGTFGEAIFEIPVTLEASADKAVKIDPAAAPALHLVHPKLWWPAGYGEANLYPVTLWFETADQKRSDQKSFQAGVRQFTYAANDKEIRIFINGRRLIARGGNWGFPESMLRYRAREYDAAVRYHREQNFNMIRNWVGQTGDDEFYDACDRHGIVVWQDFWLANPWDGPNPGDSDLFLRNARDFVLRIRNHPSVGIYCGRNEGIPPQPIEDGLKRLVAELDPALYYVSTSNGGPVGGGGPYRAMTQRFYFQRLATKKLHTELGAPTIVTWDSLNQMMPATGIWPQGAIWGLHDFTLKGAQGGTAFRDLIQKNFGGADNAADWIELAQFINYDSYRAMFEAQSRNRMGLLLWMSHPAWPSMVWQTYDYYLDPTAAYFGAKKGSEPLHIQWNAATDKVEVVNYSAGTVTGLTAQAELLNLDGSRQWEKTAALDSSEDGLVEAISLEYPASLTPVHFIRLTLRKGDKTLSENFYWRGLEENNFQALRKLPKADLEAITRMDSQGGRWFVTTEVHNVSRDPALLVRLKVVREKSGDRILPAIYSDNFVALMPGERRVIQIELADADTRGERPRIAFEGFNLGKVVAR